MRTLREWLVAVLLPEREVELEQAALTRRLLAEARLELQKARQAAVMPFEPRETDSAPPWSPEDAQWWRDALAGPRGQRIKQALNFWSNYKDRAAVTRLDRHEYACGEAAGFYLCAEFLLNKLSADIQPQSDEDGKAGQGASSLHERIAP